MKILKATTEQYEALNGYRSGVDMIVFSPDGNGDYTISKNILEDDNFLEIRDQLLELEEIDYVPMPEEE